MATVDQLADIVTELAEALARVRMEVAQVRYAMDRAVRHGKVTDVDPQKGLARIEIAEKDGDPVKSAWVPYAQHVGVDKKYKVHRPPVKGMQMTLVAPNGEIRQGFLIPLSRWDDAVSPGTEQETNVVQYDKTKIEEKADLLRTTVDKTVHEQKPEEQTVKTGDKVSIKQEMTNQELKVGDKTSHKQTETGQVLKVGDASIDMKEDSITLKVGGGEIVIKSGEITIDAPEVVLAKDVFVGMDEKGEKVRIKLITEAGPAKRAFAKPG